VKALTLSKSHLFFAALLAGFALHDPAAADPAAPPRPLTIEEATADAIYGGPHLSPSGRYLASIRREGERNYVFVANLQDPAAKPAVLSIPHAVVKWVKWDTDDRLLAALHFWVGEDGKAVPLDRIEALHTVHVVRLAAMDRDGQNFVLLLADKAKDSWSRDMAQVTDFLVDEPRHIIMPVWDEGRLDLFRVDTYAGSSQRIGKGKSSTFLWFTDKDGHPAFRIDQNWTGLKANVYARKGPGNVAAGDLEWEKVLSIPLRNESDTSVPDFYPLEPGPEPNSYYVAARPAGADTSGIYLYDFAAKKYLKTLATDAAFDIEQAYVDPDSLEYLGSTFHADRKVTRLADPALQAHVDDLRRRFGDADVYVQQVDRRAETWLLYALGPRDRGTWHIYRPKDKSLLPVGGRYPPIHTERFGSTTILRYRTRDGLDIMGYLTRPPGAAANSQPPLIMLPHGGPELRDYWEFDPMVQLLASRGYQVFQPNFRGSSGFGKRFSDAGKREWGGAMQNDLADGLVHVVKNGLATADRACIVGMSYGGYTALAAATLTPDAFRCAASIAGVSDLPLQLDAFEDQLRNDDETWRYVREHIGDPDDDEEMLEARSPARLARAVKIPILLIHGEDDRRVPVKHAELMDKALRKAGKDVRFVKVPGMGHWPDNKGWRKVYAPLLEFLEQHLPVKPPDPAAGAASPAAPSK
jgi:dipeptidyl aminopeptidase/acylaminoacyl peptidase